jgi:hypothetical protein
MQASLGVFLLNASRALRTSARGAALVEFAILLPLLLTLLTVSLELSRWMRARQHLEDYANMVAYDIAGVSRGTSGRHSDDQSKARVSFQYDI